MRYCLRGVLPDPDERVFVDWDDTQYILYNPVLRGPWLDALGFSPGYYHPLTTLTYKAEFTLFGLTPLPYHLDSLALHLANCVSAYFLLTALGARRISAFIGSLLFGVHPLHVEPAVWISGRKELLWGLFSCWSLLCYLKFIDTSRRRFYISSLLLLLLAIFSKPFAIIMPAIFLLADHYRGRRFDFRLLFEKVPFIAVALPLLLLSTMTQGFLLKNSGSNFNLSGMAASVLLSLAFYLQKLLLPLKLSGLYSSEISLGDAAGRMSFLIFIAIVVYGLGKILKKNFPAACSPDGAAAGPGLGKKAVFGLVFFLITISPALPISPAADRYAYLPALGLFFVYSELCVWVYDRAVLRRKLIIAVVTAHMLILGIASARRIPVWRNSLSLWEDVLKNQKNEQAAYFGRGNAFAAAGDYDKALADMNRCLELSPGRWDALANRGRLLVEKKELDKALADYDAAIKISPRNPRLFLNRGNIYLLKGARAMAGADYDRALAIAPDFTMALENKRRLASRGRNIR